MNPINSVSVRVSMAHMNTVAATTVTLNSGEVVFIV
jgi:hypothetical protein